MSSRHRVIAWGENTSLADRKLRAGQRLLLRVRDGRVDADLQAMLRLFLPAGFVVGASGMDEAEQFLELCRELRSLLPAAHPPLMVLSDPSLADMPPPATSWPPLVVLGELDRAHLTFDTAAAMALEFCAMGFNLAMLPRADVPRTPGGRVETFLSYRPTRVPRHLRAFLEGFQSQGIMACVGSFPGTGSASPASPGSIPVVDKDLPDLLAEDLPPFRVAVESGAAAISAANVLFPAIDEEDPASASSALLNDLLRVDLGFSGLVLVDEPILDHGPGQRRDWLHRSFLAGVDILSASLQQDSQAWLYESLVKLQEDDPSLEDALELSDQRLMRKRLEFLPLPKTPLTVLGQPAHRALARSLRGRAR